MGSRRWMCGISGVLAIVLTAAGAFAQSTDASGRYDFEATSVEGQRFTGTVLVRREGDGYGGRVFSTIRPPGAVETVEPGEGTLRLELDLGGPRPVFELTFHGDDFDGRWLLAGREGPLNGRRIPAGAHVDLAPVPCVLAGVEGLARCGVLEVPEDRSAPDGRWIPLNVAILPATEEPVEGALFHFAGGPGQAATDQAAGNAVRFTRIRTHRDIVMIDQRGTGGSNPLRCADPGPVARVRLILAWDLPEPWIRGCAETLRDRADLRHYTTDEAAADAEAVRKWLGYLRIDLYGGSYGTRAALELARLYPSHVRTVTLRAVMSPGALMATGNPRAVDGELDRVFRECRATAPCAAAYPDLEALYARLLTHLDAGSDSVSVVDPDTGDTLRLAVDRAVLGGALRRMLMSGDDRSRVPGAIAAAGVGDWSGIVPGVRNTIGVTGSLYFGMSLSVMCAEEAPRVAVRDWQRETAGTLMGDRAAAALLDACRVWDPGTPGPAFTAPARIEVPMLVLSGELDPATPAAWGAEVARDARDATQLILAGQSHADFPDCARDVMAEFVANGGLAGVDTSCVDRLGPVSYALP